MHRRITKQMLACILFAYGAHLVGAQPPDSTARNAIKVEISCFVRDVASDKPLTPATVTVLVPTPPQPAQAGVPGYYSFNGTFDAGALSTLQLSVSAPDYQERKISFRREVSEKQLVRRLVAYLISSKTQGGWSLHDRGRRWLEEGKWERSLAVFEYLYSTIPNPDDITEFNVSTVYNYARASSASCQQERYDTCALAGQLLVQVGTMCKRMAAICGKVGVAQQLIAEAAQMVSQVEQQQRIRTILWPYRDAVASFAKGGSEYQAAGQKLEDVWTEYDQQAAVWKANGVPKSAVARDIGVSYMKYIDYTGDQQDPAEREQLLKKSEHFLVQAVELGDTTPTTKTNLTIVRSQLATTPK